MFYLYAHCKHGTALVQEHDNLQELAAKMQCERIAWSDEGMSYVLADRPVVQDVEGKLSTYDDLCESIAK